eukprot:scaffold80839_cov45-Phaeocystis_antarctica.AAC.1
MPRHDPPNSNPGLGGLEASSNPAPPQPWSRQPPISYASPSPPRRACLAAVTHCVPTGRLYSHHPHPNPNPYHRAATRPSSWPLPAATSTVSSYLSSAAPTSTPRTR